MVFLFSYTNTNPVIVVPHIAPSAETGYVGTTFQFAFDITNRGSVEDTIELSARASEHPEFLHIELSKKSVILFPQESERVYLSVTAKDLVYEDIVVEAVSGNDKTKTGKRKFNVNTVYENPLLLCLKGFSTCDYEVSAPDYVKVDDESCTLISVFFDIDKTTSIAREATIVIKDKNTEDSVSLTFKLAEFSLITTNFHVWRDGYNFPNWAGHCQGMVISSIFFYLKKYPLPSGYENTYKISKDDPESISIINDFQENIRRLLIDGNHAFSAFDLDESKEYENLKRGLNRGEPVELSIWEKWPIIKLPLWKDTHSVLAYKIIEKGDVATIYIYDPDFPFKQQDYNPFGDSYRYCTYNMKSREFHYERGDESYNAFISATIEEFQQTPTPKGTVDEYCTKLHEGYQYCLNLNSDGTCTFINRHQDVEEAFDGTWEKDGKYVIREIESEMYFFTEIEGDIDVFWKLDNGNLLGERRIFFSPKATPLKSAVGMYTKETEHIVVEIELKSDGTFEERVIYSPGDYTEKWGGIWNEGENQILTIVSITEDGARSTVEYLRLDNTKIVPYYAFSNWPNPWSQIYTKQ